MEVCRTARPGSVSLMISVLGAGFITGLIPAGLLPANVLNIEQAYGLSHADVGRMVGLCMVFGGATGGLLGGWVCGRIGALRNLFIALAIVAISLGSMGLIHSLAGTVFGLAGYFFGAGFMGSSNALATNMLPSRQKGVTLLHGVNAVGKLAGPILASLFLYGAWRNSFLAAAALPLMLSVPMLLAYRTGDKQIGRKSDGHERAGLFYWVSVAGFALIAGSEIAVALWIPAYAQKVKGFSAAQGNLLLSVFLLGLITGRFTASGLSHRISSRPTIGICSVLLVFLLPVLHFTAYAQVAASFFLFGLGFSAIWPSYFAHLSRVFPQHLGLTGGTAVFSTQIGFALCSYVSGILAGVHLSYPMLFGAFVMAAFVLIFFVSPIGRARQPA